MIRRALLRAAALTSSVLAVTAFAATFAPDLDRAVATPGLNRVQARYLDVAYVRPGISLAGYDRILVEPVDVGFRSGWQPRRTASTLRLDADERDQLRLGAAQAVQRAFVQELQQGALKLTDQPGPGVLRITPHVVGLYLTDTGIPTPAPRRVYVSTIGEATFIAELSDAGTGEVLARLGDREELKLPVRVLREASPRRIASDLEAVGTTWGRAVREFVAAPTH